MRLAQPSRDELAARLEHTLLKPDATAHDIQKLCQEAIRYRFHGVCVNSSRVALAYSLLEETQLKVIAVTGFPLGAADPDVKRYETEVAIDLGASEIDVVMNIGRLKDRDTAGVLRELRDVVEAADERIVKVIIETCLLSREEKIEACQIVLDSGAHYVKTSTGLSKGGATVEDVRLLRECVGPRFGIKASGGIRDTATALALIEAGADRLGASASLVIVDGLVGD